MDRNFNKKLVLEDGSEYLGYGFGANCDAVFEIVFNTSMAGYQDIVTDPSYTDQIVCLTYPLIGNFGMASDNYETKVPTIGGIVVGEYNDHPSNFRSTTTLNEVLEDGVMVTDKNGNTFKIDADNVIMSVGYNPAPLAPKAKHVHVIGDANKVGNLRTVIWGAWDVAMKL